MEVSQGTSDLDPLLTRMAGKHPFDLRKVETTPAKVLKEQEDDRISYLPEFSRVFTDTFLFHDMMEFFDGDVWSNALKYVTARNIYRALCLPYSRKPAPDDLQYAAEFFGVRQTAQTTWLDIHDAFLHREQYMHAVQCALDSADSPQQE